MLNPGLKHKPISRKTSTCKNPNWAPSWCTLNFWPKSLLLSQSQSTIKA